MLSSIFLSFKYTSLYMCKRQTANDFSYLTKQQFPHTSGIDSKIRKVSLLENLFRVQTVTDKSHATLK